MDRAWKQFTDDASTYRSDVPPAVLEQADDVHYQVDFDTLVAGYRILIDGEPRTAAAFARQLQDLGKRLLDDFGPGGLFEQQAFSDYGPQALLRAFARAYEAPQHVVSDVVEHP